MGLIHPGGLAEKATHKSDAIYEAAIGRKPAFPLYILCNTGDSRMLSACDYKPGRILFAYDVDDGVLGGVPAETLCPQDVLWVDQDSTQPENRMMALRELADQVSAILLGAGGPEIGIGCPTQAATDETRTAQVLSTTEFVKRTGGEIRDMGGRPAYGITHFTTLLHCYWATRHMPGGVDPLVKAAQDVDALFIDFLGFAFWLSPGVMQPLDHWDPTSTFIRKDYLDPWPFAQLKAWHEQFECWGGVDFIEGLVKGNDVPMAAGGFSAGVIGELPGAAPVVSAPAPPPRRVRALAIPKSSGDSKLVSVMNVTDQYQSIGLYHFNPHEVRVLPWNIASELIKREMFELESLSAGLPEPWAG